MSRASVYLWKPEDVVLLKRGKGGPGSGFRGHVGRTGARGGSAHPPKRGGEPERQTRRESAVDLQPEDEGLVKPTVTVQRMSARTLAKQKIEEVKEIEPEVTERLKMLADENEGQMWGEEFKFKSEESLERKINADAVEGGMTLEEASQEITDVLRYTITFDDPATMVDNTKSVIEQLRQDGFEVYDHKIRNYFGPGDSYDGYNVVFVEPSTGLRFELQFHTIESVEIKETVHVIYQEWRTLAIDDPRRKELSIQMTSVWMEYERPVAWESLEGIRMDA